MRFWFKQITRIRIETTNLILLIITENNTYLIRHRYLFMNAIKQFVVITQIWVFKSLYALRKLQTP